MVGLVFVKLVLAVGVSQSVEMVLVSAIGGVLIVGLVTLVGRSKKPQTAIVPVALQQVPRVGRQDDRPDVFAQVGVEIRAGAGCTDPQSLARQYDPIGSAARHRSSDVRGRTRLDVNATIVKIPRSALPDRVSEIAGQYLGERGPQHRRHVGHGNIAVRSSAHTSSK